MLTLRRLRICAAVGLGGLAALGLAYVLTNGPAPSIRVRWRDDLGLQRQAALERKYLLANGRAPMENAPRSLAYDLLDTSRWNIWAMVTDPDVADTNDIDRDEYRVRPNTHPGERWTWLARRVPGLRYAGVLWTVLGALSVIGLVGGVGLIVEQRRRAQLGTAPAGDPGDVFDRLPWLVPILAPVAADGRPHLASRLVAGALLAAAIGFPILDTWEVLVLAIGLLAVVFGVGRPERWRLCVAVAIVLAVVALKTVLPRADIAEAHNVFTVINDGEALQKGLPPEIFASWKAQFDVLYPRTADPVPYSWRSQGAVPKTLFTASADAIWRTPRYSRQVDAIDFSSLGEFRGGFANQSDYNFWNGELAREDLPFFVMYELTPASVGSRLTWQGQLFWEGEGGRFDEVVHAERASRGISPADPGRRVYAVFFPARDEHRQVRFEPSVSLRVSAWVGVVLTFAASLAVLWLTVRPRWSPYLRALLMFGLASWLMSTFLDISGRHTLGHSYPPHGGGDDGLAHDGWGHAMALLVGRGEVVEALKGGEAIYWFTPGLRYLRMVEKLIFGDTNLLYALLLACTPIALFYFVRQFIGTRLAWIVTAFFCLVPVGNLSYLQYVTNARIGYAEAAGAGLFLLGIALLFRTQPAWGGTGHAAMTGAAGAALAASLFVRPNFALTVVWLGAAWAGAAWRRHQPWTVVPLALGLSLALWMPFHNWYYGGEFFLISKSTTVATPVGPGEYIAAAGDLVRGRFDSAAVSVIANQLQGWLDGPAFVDLFSVALLPLAWAAHVVRLIALALTGWVVLRWAAGRFAKGTDLAVVAVGALLAHLPMLFVHDTFDRYAMLGWDLSLLVLIVWFVRLLPIGRAAPAKVTA